MIKRQASHRRAFTLVELLVALALASVLVVATGQVTISTLQTQRAVEQKIVERERRQKVFDILSSDWSRRMGGLPGLDSGLRLIESANSTLEFACLAPVPDTDLHVTLLPAIVRYRVQSEHGESVLVREITEAAAPGHPSRQERVATRVAEFQAELWIDGQWVKGLPTGKNRQSQPRMLRVSVRFEGQSKPLRRTFEMDQTS